ncbi:MAG: hypothetical protein K0U74_11845 [Alphaproteobacteria bacterium]|nr:hypothetical protein [Alphaproteobacteria bacterium]
MSRDYAEMEREFLNGLKADTGRDLGEWMLAINAQNLAHRNDIIDWLRQQGFLFAWASWLERIHHNGGTPIYNEADAETADGKSDASDKPASNDVRPEKLARPAPPVERPVASKSPSTPTAPPAGLRLVHSAPPATSSPKAPAPANTVSARAPGSISTDVRAVVASAKAFAPLAGFVIKKIIEVVPETDISASKKSIVFAAPLPFAVLVITGKDLKLAFAGPPGAFEARCERAKLPAASSALPPGLTLMISLSDARQVDEAFAKIIKQAWSRANAT